MEKTITETLKVVRGMLGIFADKTPSEIDDKILKLIDAFLASPEILDWLDEMLNSAFTATSYARALSAPTEQLSKAAAAADIDWHTLVTVLLPIIFDLLRRYTTKAA